MTDDGQQMSSQSMSYSFIPTLIMSYVFSSYADWELGPVTLPLFKAGSSVEKALKDIFSDLELHFFTF